MAARKLFVLTVLMALATGTAAAQDARTVLQAAAKALGAENLRCVTYSGSGFVGLVGQQYDLRDDWPRVDLMGYSRTINYDAKSSVEERTVRQGSYAPRGGGFQPIQGEQKTTQIVSGDRAWNLNAQGQPAPQPAAAEVRQLDIMLTPYGFLKAAMAASDAKVLTRYESGALGTMASFQRRKATVVSFTALGKYRVNGQFNDQNILTRVQTRVADPVMGDINYETEYSDYKDFGGLKFPTHFHHHDAFDDETQPPNYNGGHNGIDFRVTNVQPNACGAALTVPDAVRTATVPPVRVESQQLANGVWYLRGGSHHSIAVEFQDFVAVVEGPLNEARSLAVIEEVHKLIPNKPIEYLVNTHHHFDHLGGVRTFVWEGATIVTQENNYGFYKNQLVSHEPWTIAPDRLALYPPTEQDEGYIFEVVSQKHTISDGKRTLSLYYVQGLNHSNDMLMAYLPAEKIVIQADLYNAPAPNAPPPTGPPSPSALTFYENVKAYKLDVTTIAPLHGPGTATWSQFARAIGKPE
jgi:glyoxylase-like metal-dependent hydrolase (beta-lactamase superfamily II)